METLMYYPDPAMLQKRRLLGLAFAALGGGVGCLFALAGGVVFASALIIAPPTALPLAVIPCVGVAVIGLFGLIGGVIAFSDRDTRLELTADALSLVRGKDVVALRLAEIARLEGRWRRGGRGAGGHWQVVIANAHGGEIALDIPQGLYLATFDVPPVLRDLLPRLPPTVQIDARVHSYLNTGRMTR